MVGIGGGGGSSGRNAVESDARTNRNTGNAVQKRNANSKRSANRANHGAAREIRQNRRQKRVLLVPKPQSAGAAEAKAP